MTKLKDTTLGNISAFYDRKFIPTFNKIIKDRKKWEFGVDSDRIIEQIKQDERDVPPPLYLARFYVLTNISMLELLDKNEVSHCLDLIGTENDDNIIIGAQMLYTLIDNKKKEIKKKLKSK